MHFGPPPLSHRSSPIISAAGGWLATSSLNCQHCNKSFASNAQYSAHLNSHQTCEVCGFVGSKTSVQAHIATTHGQYAGTGYKQVFVEGKSFTVLLGTDPQLVAEWREQRRKNWPSARNIERKRKERPLVDYDSDEDEPHQQQAHRKKFCRFFVHSGRCDKGSMCAYSHDLSDRALCPYYFRGDCRHGNKCKNAHFDHAGISEKPRQQTSLLRKLLHNDIRAETHLVLAIFRHIVDTYPGAQHRW